MHSYAVVSAGAVPSSMMPVPPQRTMPTATAVAPPPSPMGAPSQAAMGQAPDPTAMQRPGPGEMNLQKITQFLASKGIDPQEANRIAQAYLTGGG